MRTNLMAKAIAVTQELPADIQDEAARLLLLYVGDRQEHTVTLTDEEREAVVRSREAVARGEIATDEQVAAVWAKYDR